MWSYCWALYGLWECTVSTRSNSCTVLDVDEGAVFITNAVTASFVINRKPGSGEIVLSSVQPKATAEEFVTLHKAPTKINKYLHYGFLDVIIYMYRTLANCTGNYILRDS